MLLRSCKPSSFQTNRPSNIRLPQHTPLSGDRRRARHSKKGIWKRLDLARRYDGMIYTGRLTYKTSIMKTKTKHKLLHWSFRDEIRVTRTYSINSTFQTPNAESLFSHAEKPSHSSFERVKNNSILYPSVRAKRREELRDSSEDLQERPTTTQPDRRASHTTSARPR